MYLYFKLIMDLPIYTGSINVYQIKPEEIKYSTSAQSNKHPLSAKYTIMVVA